MADMSNIRKKAKNLWIRGMKTIGNTAANIANNTKYKVDEMSLQNKRREIAGDLSSTVYAMWLKGTRFPAEVTRMLEEIQRLDNRLNDMQAEKYAQNRRLKESDTEAAVAEADRSAPPSAEEIPVPDEMPETASERSEKSEMPEDSGDSETEEIPVSYNGTIPSLESEINVCFDQGATVDRMAERVNSSLDQLTERIRSFSPDAGDREKNNEPEEIK